IARDVRLAFMTITSMILICAQLAVMAFLCLTLTHEANYGLALAIVMFTVSQLGAIAGRIFWGWASDKIFRGSRPMTLVAVCVITAGATLAVSLVTPGLDVWIVGCICIAVGFMAEGWFGVAVLGFAEIGGEEHSGSALGVALTWAFLAAFIAPTLFGAVAQIYGFSLAWRALAFLTLAGIPPALLASAYMQKLAATAKA
ncbi:MAG TPA: hypothetical protein VKR05_02535, partial [Candidatus Cybelea sp.]|nr:hypothetical protein [Candidatus Cybelea sp.]